ncbi:MAG: helix-turn-helix domain-containing protein [Christensenellales bacterium]
MNKFPETLKLYRKAEKISQVKLAEICNVSQGTIAKWENGYQEPDIDTLILLSNIFGVTIDELVGKQ